MTVRRTLLLTLLLLVLAAAAAVGVLYRNLPAIIAAQGRAFLASYGVTSVESTRPQLGFGRARLDGLMLAGALDGVRFQAELGDVDIRYNLASLAQGELQRVTLGKLALALVITPPAATGEPAAPLALDELLPRTVAELLPVGTFSIGDLALDITGEGLPVVAARGHLTLAQRLQLQLEAQSLGTDIGLSLDAGPSPVDATISLRAQQGETLLSRLDARSSRSRAGVWTWQLDGGVEIGPLATWLAAPDVRAALALEPAALDRLGQLQPGGSVTASGTLTHSDRVEPGTFVKTLSANIDVGGHGLHLQPAGDGHTLRGDFTGQLALSPGQVRLALSASEAGGSVPTEQLGLSAQVQETLGWGAGSQVSWRQAGPATLAMGEDGHLTATLIAGTLQAGSGGTELTLALQETAAVVRPGAPTRPQLDTAFALSGKLRDKPLPPVSGSISLADQAGGDDQALSLLLSEPAGTLSVAVNGSGAPLDGKGQYQASARLAQAAGAVARYLPLLPPGTAPSTVPVVRAGSVDFSATVGAKGWGTPEHWQWRSQLNANGLALTYDTYTVDGLSLQAAWRGLAQWQTTRPALVSAERIDVGFPIEQLSAQVSLPRPTPPGAPDLRLEALQMTLLGGRAFLPEPQAWNFASQRNSLALQVEDLALADIVALQQNRQISAEGRLSGRLPVSLNGPRLTIDRGYVKAAPGGVIRYRPDEASAALAGSSRELGMAIRLLGNFHYDVLSSEVALDEGGNLLLGLSLAGRNPEYEAGRAVNFNINLEQNIDPLLQSLRLGGSVSKQLEKKRR